MIEASRAIHMYGQSWLKSSGVNTHMDTSLAAQYHHIAQRKGKWRAVMAVAHSLFAIICHVLKEKNPYEELGADYFVRLDIE